MARRAFLAASCLLILCAAPASAQETCTLCIADPHADPAQRPLEIEITAGLEFSRLALTGHGTGEATIDPQTGSKHTDGEMMDLGGFAVQGKGRITGAPNKPVRIELPPQVTMTSSTGTTAVLKDFVTDLPAFPVLDGGGALEFSFGGRIEVTGPTGGTFRGSIPITVDYN